MQSTGIVLLLNWVDNLKNLARPLGTFPQRASRHQTQTQLNNDPANVAILEQKAVSLYLGRHLQSRGAVCWRRRSSTVETRTRTRTGAPTAGDSWVSPPLLCSALKIANSDTETKKKKKPDLHSVESTANPDSIKKKHPPRARQR